MSKPDFRATGFFQMTTDSHPESGGGFWLRRLSPRPFSVSRFPRAFRFSTKARFFALSLLNRHLRKFLFLLAVFSVSWGISAAANAQRSALCEGQATENLKKDCAELEALYDAAGGSSWKTRTNWKQSNNLNTWHGVTVTSGRVTDLSLSNNGLSGTIPDLSDLTALEWLDLSDNGLSGTIPDLSGLTALEYMLLSDNSLTGRIVASHFPPDNLISLFLYNNMLSGTIPDLSALTSLQQLYLYSNMLSGTIPDMSALTALQLLKLQENSLSGPIPDLSDLTALQYLELYDNNLNGQINASDFPPGLQTLYLQGNRLNGPIPNLNSLTALLTLQLDENRLSGTINISHFPTSLRQLHLNSNRLSGTIPDLSLASLQLLDLGRNGLSGTIPNLSPTSMRILKLQENRLSGTINILHFPTSLRQLHLNSNRLSGTIPDLSNRFYYMQILYLQENRLSGTINILHFPTGLWGLTLGQNSLSGEIPDLSSRLTYLTWLYLNDNSLSGEIPDMSGLTYLRWLYLNDNSLSGEIPDLSGLTTITRLAYWGNPDLSFANVTLATGKDTVIDRTALRSLYDATGGADWNDSTNWLSSAPLGEWYGVATDDTSGRVTALDLSGNGLTGDISNSLEVLDSLTTLNLSDNENLAGELAVRLKDVSGLSNLDIECTDVETPSASNFQNWLSALSSFLKGCPGSPAVVPGIQSLTVSWAAATGAGSYKVQWKSGSQDWDETARQNTVSGGSATTSKITGLAGGTEYTVRVIATKKTGEDYRTPSEEVKGTPESPPSPPPPPPPPAPEPSKPVSPDGSVLITETDDGFAFTPVDVGGSVIWGTKTVEFTVAGNDGLSPNPTIILSRTALSAVADAGGNVTFDISADLSGDPPSGFRLGGLVADIGLGVDDARDTVGVCLPADAEAEGPVVHLYDGESGRWEPLAEQETAVLNGVRSVCGKTYAFPRFGLFVAVPPVTAAAGGGGGGCAVAGTGSGSAIPPADLLSAALLLLAAAVSRFRGTAPVPDAFASPKRIRPYSRAVTRKFQTSLTSL